MKADRSAPGSEIGIVSEIGGLEALRPEWEALLARDPGATPFQSPSWLIAWWRHYGPGELLALTLRRGARLAALLPLYLSRDPDDGVLRLLGCGNSDYLGPLLDPELAAARDLAPMLGRLDTVPGWLRCDLVNLPQHSPLLDPGATPPQWGSEVAEEETCPVLALSAQALAGGPGSAIPRRMLRNLRNDRGRLDRLGPNRVIGASREALEPLFAELVRLHEARWAARGEPGVIATARDRAFHLEAMRALLAQGMLRLFGIALGEGASDKIVGAYYGFVHAGSAYAYLGGFDPAFSRVSLGTLLIGHAIESALAEGVGAFHFLRGREAYKYEWGAVDRPTRRRVLTRP